MSVENLEGLGAPRAQETAVAARRLMRTALKGSLATLDRISGHPFASLVLVATEPDGSPIFLISRLALHTQNLSQDTRASLLLDGTGELGDPLTGGRLTLVGHARPSTSPTAKPRFLSRHASARTYADFPDFSMFALEITGGHYVGGFGKIVSLTSPSLVVDVVGAERLIAAEAEIVGHMNGDHADAVDLYATVLAKCATGTWRMAGMDPQGFDLLHCNKTARVEFARPVRTPNEARAALVDLVKQARAQKPALGPK